MGVDFVVVEVVALTREDLVNLVADPGLPLRIDGNQPQGIGHGVSRRIGAGGGEDE